MRIDGAVYNDVLQVLLVTMREVVLLVLSA